MASALDGSAISGTTTSRARTRARSRGWRRWRRRVHPSPRRPRVPPRRATGTAASAPDAGTCWRRRGHHPARPDGSGATPETMSRSKRRPPTAAAATPRRCPPHPPRPPPCRLPRRRRSPGPPAPTRRSGSSCCCGRSSPARGGSTRVPPRPAPLRSTHRPAGARPEVATSPSASVRPRLRWRPKHKAVAPRSTPRATHHPSSRDGARSG